MHHIAVNGLAIWANVWGFAFGFLAGGFAGYGLAVRNHDRRVRTRNVITHLVGDHTPGDHAREVELAITQDPLAWPVGHEWAHLDGAGRRYIVSRLEDLGSISVIGVGQVQQWRVYGRPA